MVEPIKPDDVAVAKKEILPDSVIDTFNHLIAKHWDGSSSKFEMQEAKELIMSKLDCTAKYIFDNGYMNVEPVYELQGWKVYYDRPAYDENYKATYEFSRK